MIIKTLVENTSSSPVLMSEHGFSIYIESNNNKILFDLGASNLFLENAKKMNINIKDIDLVIISHGHYDHGGGLRAFLEENEKASVYIHRNAFENHYSKIPGKNPVDAGIDRSLKWHERLIFTDDSFLVDKKLELFSNVTGREFFSSCNDSLYMELDEFLVRDNFQHEQNLLIKEDGKTVLVAGCAHNGIVNIMKHVLDIDGSFPDYVISGFHLFNNRIKKSEDPAVIEGIANFLKKTKTKYYTGHCTGLEVYHHLKEIMGEQIQYLATGTVVKI